MLAYRHPLATAKAFVTPDALSDGRVILAAVGVTHLQVRPPSRTCDEQCDQIAAFGSEVAPLVADAAA